RPAGTWRAARAARAGARGDRGADHVRLGLRPQRRPPPGPVGAGMGPPRAGLVEPQGATGARGLVARLVIDHQGTTPFSSTNVPVGPDLSTSAILTMISAPCSTGLVPRCSLKSVAV